MNQRCKYLAVALPIVKAPKVRTTGAAAISSSMSKECATYHFDIRPSCSIAVVLIVGSKSTCLFQGNVGEHHEQLLPRKPIQICRRGWEDRREDMFSTREFLNFEARPWERSSTWHF